MIIYNLCQRHETFKSLKATIQGGRCRTAIFHLMDGEENGLLKCGPGPITLFSVPVPVLRLEGLTTGKMLGQLNGLNTQAACQKGIFKIKPFNFKITGLDVSAQCPSFLPALIHFDYLPGPAKHPYNLGVSMQEMQTCIITGFLVSSLVTRFCFRDIISIYLITLQQRSYSPMEVSSCFVLLIGGRNFKSQGPAGVM